MTELLIRIINLPQLAQKSIAGILLAVVGLIAILVLMSAFNTLTDLRSRIDDGRNNLTRFDQLLAQRPANVDQPVDEAESGFFLEGESIAIVQANLQTRLSGIAKSQHATVASVGNAPAMTIEGVQYVGVRADIQGELPALHNTIFQLETSIPRLIIREATIRSTNTIQQGDLTAPIELVGQITVYGAINPALLPSDQGRPRP